VISDAIYYLGTNHGGLTALIGTNLYPVAERREHQVPRVVFELEEPDPVAGIRQDSGWWHTRVVFSCYGVTQRAAGLIAEQVRACYQRYFSNGAVVGTTTHKIDDVKATGSGSQYYDPELDQFVEDVELELFHT
jgi:hypothetical protein